MLKMKLYVCINLFQNFRQIGRKKKKSPKFGIFFLLQFDSNFLKYWIEIKKKRTMLRGEATLPLWFEPSHDYVGPADTEIIYGPVGLIRAGFSAVDLFLSRKLKIFQEQNVKGFQFYIRMPNFRLPGSIIKKEYLNVADPLKKSRLLFFGCFDLESGRIKLSRPGCKCFFFFNIIFFTFNANVFFIFSSFSLTLMQMFY